MYYRWLKSIVFTRHIMWAATACILNIFENLGLIGLTYVSSKENYSNLKISLILFITRVFSSVSFIYFCRDSRKVLHNLHGVFGALYDYNVSIAVSLQKHSSHFVGK